MMMSVTWAMMVTLLVDCDDGDFDDGDIVFDVCDYEAYSNCVENDHGDDDCDDVCDDGDDGGHDDDCDNDGDNDGDVNGDCAY